jgi:hypothetical protein
MTAGALLVVVLELAMLSQGGSLSGMFSPDLLLVVVSALCAAGIAASGPRFRKPSHRALSAVAALTAVILLSVAWNGSGGGAPDPAAAANETSNGTQLVTSTLSYGRYPNITVRAGIPVKWVINAPEGSLNGCNYRISIPEYGISHSFKIGENIIEFTPARAGNFRYSCWMGMIRGTITVTDENAG